MKKYVRPIFRIRCDKCGREDIRTYRTLSLLPQVYTCKSCENSEVSATNAKVVFKVLKTIILTAKFMLDILCHMEYWLMNIICNIKRWWRARRMLPYDLADRDEEFAMALRKYAVYANTDDEVVPVGFSFEAAELLESSAKRIRYLEQILKGEQ